MRAETDALRAERRQYGGWISGEVEGGEAFRVSMALHVERAKHRGLEEQIRDVRNQLTDISAHVRQLVEEANGETPNQRKMRLADEAMSALERLKQVSEATTREDTEWAAQP